MELPSDETPKIPTVLPPNKSHGNLLFQPRFPKNLAAICRNRSYPSPVAQSRWESPPKKRGKGSLGGFGMAKKSWSRVLEGTGGAGSAFGAGSIPGKHSQPEASAGKGDGAGGGAALQGLSPREQPGKTILGTILSCLPLCFQRFVLLPCSSWEFLRKSAGFGGWEH